MSASDQTGVGTDQQRQHWRKLDRDDLLGLQSARVFAFGAAICVAAMQIIAFLTQREMGVFGDSAQLFGLGGVAVGFLCGQLIETKRRILALEQCLAEANGSSDQ